MSFKYKAVVEYDGSGYLGWQRQSHVSHKTSIQACIETAIHKMTGENAIVYAAGRTDAGVHAIAQVCHFGLIRHVHTERLLGAINYSLKINGHSKIIIIKMEEVDQHFHARFSAVSRGYIYRIFNRRLPSIFEINKSWTVPEALDSDQMHNAAQILIGTHDFTSFRTTQCQSKSPIKTISSIVVFKPNDVFSINTITEQSLTQAPQYTHHSSNVIHIYIKSRSFLHNQVRIIVGTLRNIGNGKWDQNKMEEILAAQDRSKAGQTAPAHGLYLNEVLY